MDFLDSILTAIGAFIGAHTVLTYAILFWGSFFETLIGIGFFLYGELIFIPASLLAGAHVLNIWLVSFFLIAGGIAGDSASFFIGRKYGVKLFKEEHRFLNHTNRAKGEEFFKKYGDKGIFLARLLGPLSWITPFLAGIYAVPYSRFLKYNIPGVFAGIGEFLIVGYFFGSRYKEVLSFIQTYVAIIIFVILVSAAVYLIVKRNYPQLLAQVRNLWQYEKRKLFKSVLKHMAAVILIVFLIYVAFLYILFFVEGGTNNQPTRTNLPIFMALNELQSETNFLVFRDGAKQPVQPVNVIMVLKGDVEDRFQNNNWLRDVLFSEANLTAKAFIRLWRDHEPPVSDLFLDGYPQELAFQEKTQSSLRRLHIRLWPIGFLENQETRVYLGSVSSDDGLSLAIYNHFPVPFHQVSPDADSARDAIATAFLGDLALASSTYETWGKVVASTKDDEQAYFTDGRVLLLQFK
ncbi:MAG: LssY C-terminal domain-containing protein [Candidatus Paceibacterota bacterium]|jgi:membrane-associated protein